MSKRRKRDPFGKVLVLTILFALLAAACFGGIRYLNQRRDAELQSMIDEVNAENQAAQQTYVQQIAEFEASLNRGGANEAWPSPPTGTGWEVVDLTSYPIEQQSARTVNRQEAMYNGMLLVNEWHSRPLDFSEDTLIPARSGSGNAIRVHNNSVRLFPDAVNAWKELFTAAQVQKGYEYFMLGEDAYRSYEDQQEIFNDQKTKLSRRYTDEDDLIEATKRYVNFPGTSEFNTGLSAKVRLYLKGNAEVNAKDNDFFSSEEGIWLYENSWKYGLVFRFPLADYPVKGTQDKSYKTGISKRLRVFRYVGKGNAAAMQAMGFCLEEYIDYLTEHPHIAVFENGTLRYEITRQYVGDEDDFQVIVTGKNGVRNTVVSLDNMGCAVVVFEY